MIEDSTEIATAARFDNDACALSQTTGLPPMMQLSSHLMIVAGVMFSIRSFGAASSIAALWSRPRGRPGGSSLAGNRSNAVGIEHYAQSRNIRRRFAGGSGSPRGLNYRLTRGGNKRFQRIEEADKIKILEDTDGDGKADKATVFADRVFPVPMGIAVEEHFDKAGKYQGCRVFVGNSPDLLVLEDTDGDDKADKRYPLLTGFGGVDSDHGVHGMVLGLDGKLYFSHGDGCCSVHKITPAASELRRDR